MKIRPVVGLVVLGCGLAGLGSAQEVDLLIRGGRVLDGSGTEAVRADVAIRGDRIVAVGDLPELQAERTIDATGLYVAPGFIDLHSHAEGGLSDPHLSAARNNVTQGITTVVVGQDGRHAWPVGGSLRQQAELWRSHGIGNNVVPLVGQGSTRLEVMGFSQEPATPQQARAMAQRVEELLAQGVWGISTGLSYVPGRFSPTEEVIEATRPVKAINGFYISHLRNQAENLVESIDETIRIAKEAGVRVVATHLKASGRGNWGRARDAVARMTEARKEGIPIFGDLYPYETSSDGIDVALVPLRTLFQPEELRSLAIPGKASAAELVEWALRRNPGLRHRYTRDFLMRDPETAVDELLGRTLSGDLRTATIYRQRLREVLADEARRDALLAAVDRRIKRPGGAEIFVLDAHPEESLVGRTLGDVARGRRLSVPEAAVELTLEGAAFTQMHMSEEDIASYIQWPYMAACTDGWIPEYGAGLTHPRSYGTFTRRIRRYVYELGVIDLPFAVHTATGLPTEIIDLKDRGYVREGLAADVIAFDPLRIRDRATFRNPHRYSEGIEWVVVNGVLVVEAGAPNGKRAGRVLLKTETKASVQGKP